MRTRFGLLAAIICTFVLFLLSGSTVWDIRVDGIPPELVDKFKAELSENGLYIGADWGDISNSKVEAGVLSKSDTVSWLNINRRGSVAYISAVQKEVHHQKETPQGYANIVATRDCIIEDIVVRCGVAAVKVGQSVKEGDLLISGVIPSEQGGGFCYADGDVRGRFSDSVSVFVSSVEEYKAYTDEYVSEARLNIFDFSINIFKRYRNLSAMCDIIEEKNEFLLGDGKTLPFFINKTVIREYSIEKRTLSLSEMSEKASELLRARLGDFLSDKDLLSIKIAADSDAHKYELMADMVLCGNVAKTSGFEFETEKK